MDVNTLVVQRVLGVKIIARIVAKDRVVVDAITIALEHVKQVVPVSVQPHVCTLVKTQANPVAQLITRRILHPAARHLILVALNAVILVQIPAKMAVKQPVREAVKRHVKTDVRIVAILVARVAVRPVVREVVTKGVKIPVIPDVKVVAKEDVLGLVVLDALAVRVVAVPDVTIHAPVVAKAVA